MLAGGLGFEPRLKDSKSLVLPLYDPPSLLGVCQTPSIKYQFIEASTFLQYAELLGLLSKPLLYKVAA